MRVVDFSFFYFVSACGSGFVSSYISVLNIINDVFFQFTLSTFMINILFNPSLLQYTSRAATANQTPLLTPLFSSYLVL